MVFLASKVKRFSTPAVITAPLVFPLPLSCPTRAGAILYSFVRIHSINKRRGSALHVDGGDPQLDCGDRACFGKRVHSKQTFKNRNKRGEMLTFVRISSSLVGWLQLAKSPFDIIVRIIFLEKSAGSCPSYLEGMFDPDCSMRQE